jgi:hypothetical protein
LRNLEANGRFMEPNVVGPQPTVSEQGRSQEVGVNPADPFAEKPMLLDEAQDFVIFRRYGRRQLYEVAQYTGPMLKIAAGDFAEHEGVHQNLLVDQGLLQPGICLPEVIYPN